MTRVGENPQRLPKRFYRQASKADGALLLDGRSAKTKSGKLLRAPFPSLIDEMVCEWNAQAEEIDFSAMPMTRFAMTVIDLGESDSPRWRESLTSFLKSDSLCYRATEPAALVEQQTKAWDPLLDWAAANCGVGLMSGAGLSFIEQPAPAIAKAEKLFAAETPASLLAMKVAAEISGSAVIALALARRAFAPQALFDAARVDEDFQSARWGADAEATARRESLRREFLDASKILSLV